MTLSTDEEKAMAAEWSAAQCLYPVYLGIAGRFRLRVSPCPEIRLPDDRIGRTELDAVRRWQDRMDDAIQVHQLRVFLQTSAMCTEEVLRELARHQLRKAESASDADRDKLDFLLVQYFSHCVPPEAAREPSLHDVAGVLQPVLGEAASDDGWDKSLKTVLLRVTQCASLRELLQAQVLTEIRRIKELAGGEYWRYPALIAFTRFNYLLRQTFFGLMQADVVAIREGVRRLSQRGVSDIDCERAQLSRQEPLETVLKACRQWRKPFHAEYSAGNPFAQIAELRVAVEQALSNTREPGAAQNAEIPCDTNAIPDLDSELNRVIVRLPTFLEANPRSREIGTTILSGDARLLLFPDEVRVFLDQDGAASDLVRRTVACRLLLFQALERVKRGEAQMKLHGVVALAKAQIGRVPNGNDQIPLGGQTQHAASLDRLRDLIRDAELTLSELSRDCVTEATSIAEGLQGQQLGAKS